MRTLQDLAQTLGRLSFFGGGQVGSSTQTADQQGLDIPRPRCISCSTAFGVPKGTFQDPSIFSWSRHQKEALIDVNDSGSLDWD